MRAFPHCTLGHERLCIVGGMGGAQPIQEHGCALVANGEIYNHEALRKRCAASYVCATASDCEVIAGVLSQPGQVLDQMNMLDGQFAFVWTDVGTGRVIVGRDPLGICSLYMARGGSYTYVVSEMKALEGVDDLEDVTLFPPGHVWDSLTGDMRAYYMPMWMMPVALPTQTHADAHMRACLTQAVRKRLMSDPGVQVGVLLSGGLDSSLITSMAMRLMRDIHGPRAVLHSFSIGMAGSPDLAAARLVATFLGTTHHEVVYTPQDGLDALEDVIYHVETYDMTTVRASTPNYLLGRAIRAAGVKVVLSGEAADELFAGYTYFKACPTRQEMFTETCRKVTQLHMYDFARAHKSLLASGVEVRVPFADQAVVHMAMTMDPKHKLSTTHPEGPRIEKDVLRNAFDTPDDPYLPKTILFRAKDQFSDAVSGHVNWITTCQDEAAHHTFPPVTQNPPFTLEHALYRHLFDAQFVRWNAMYVQTVPHQKSCACSTEEALRWSKTLVSQADPSGRVTV